MHTPFINTCIKGMWFQNLGLIYHLRMDEGKGVMKSLGEGGKLWEDEGRDCIVN